MMRIGIDVGGTHTDAVLMDGDEIVAATKALTTADVRSGILEAIEIVLQDRAGLEGDIEAVMLGTTQFTNAVVERRQLAEVAAIRVGLPSGEGLPPKVGWPDDIARALGDAVYMIAGGTLYDGAPLADIDDAELDAVIADLQQRSVDNVAISASFSPMQSGPERIVAERVRAALPEARITLSHDMGSLGLLERENAALLNASLLPFADQVVRSFVAAIEARGLRGRFFVSQNDGTLMAADFARQYPALTFASGPTNSLRGAARLTGLGDAIVIDIGGTTSDIGILQAGFPRVSNLVTDVGGVRTNFRMPDILALGLGGGSRVRDGGRTLGPDSVGHDLVNAGLVFGGYVLTATDIIVASGHASIGDAAHVTGLESTVVREAITTITEMLNRGIESMRPNQNALPVILVGGGALLSTEPLSAASEVLRPENAGVANAIGAAIGQIGGEAEQMIAYNQTPRTEAIELVRAQATKRAVSAGADAASLAVIDVEETAMSYSADDVWRVRVKVVGNIAGLHGAGSSA